MYQDVNQIRTNRLKYINESNVHIEQDLKNMYLISCSMDIEMYTEGVEVISERENDHLIVIMSLGRT